MYIPDKDINKILKILIAQQEAIEYFLRATPVGVHNLSSIEDFRKLVNESDKLILYVKDNLKVIENEKNTQS